MEKAPQLAGPLPTNVILESDALYVKLTDYAHEGNKTMHVIDHQSSKMLSQLRPAHVLSAADRIRPFIRRTPLVRSNALSAIAGGDVYLKLENEQITGSFKLRGATNVLASLSPDVRARGVVASSAGNHGIGVAYAAKHFNTPATIFVPSTVAHVKRDAIAALGASIDSTRPHYDAAMEAAIEFAAERDATFINPCLGDVLLAGQGTIALEILAELPELATLALGVGGGGLLGGCASIVRAIAPSVRIVGAQSENTAAMSLSMAAGRVVEIENLPTIADGLAGQIDEAGLDLGQRGLDAIVTLSESEIAQAIAWLWAEHGQRVEGAGACAAAAIWLKKLDLPTPVAIVISGGNIDPAKFEQIVGAYES
ncbi:MAG TPA: threonine/serine dehydratase [Gemmatimonadaceae bacterium]|nr:threonine/serine dehydratase [Gemmatimonadaceae bacterium]